MFRELAANQRQEGCVIRNEWSRVRYSAAFDMLMQASPADVGSCGRDGLKRKEFSRDHRKGCENGAEPIDFCTRIEDNTELLYNFEVY